MQIETVEIAGKPAEWMLPEGEVAGAAVFLHGYDGVTLRERSAYHAALQRRQLACLSPIGPHCWWSNAIYPAFDAEISPVDYVRIVIAEHVQSRFPNRATPLGVFGFEMGGQGALQVAYRAPRVFANVVAISPKVDFETWHGHGTSLDEMFPDRESARQQIATLQLNPLNWPKRQLLLCDPKDLYCLEGVVTLASKLASSGVPFEQDFTTSHGGFGWDYVDAMAERAACFLVGQ